MIFVTLREHIDKGHFYIAIFLKLRPSDPRNTFPFIGFNQFLKDWFWVACARRLSLAKAMPLLRRPSRKVALSPGWCSRATSSHLVLRGGQFPQFSAFLQFSAIFCNFRNFPQFLQLSATNMWFKIHNLCIHFLSKFVIINHKHVKKISFGFWLGCPFPCLLSGKPKNFYCNFS